MNTDEIIAEYTQADSKSGCITKLSKKLKVPKSTIIAELFKSGYKYEELKRVLPNEYAAALKKYEQWEIDGRPETVLPVPEPEKEEPVQKSEEKEVITGTVAPAIIRKKQESDADLYEKDMEELEQLKKDNEHHQKIIDTLIKDKADILEDYEALKKERDREENEHNKNYSAAQVEIVLLTQKCKELSDRIGFLERECEGHINYTSKVTENLSQLEVDYIRMKHRVEDLERCVIKFTLEKYSEDKEDET